MYITREEYNEYKKLKEELNSVKASLENKHLSRKRDLLSEVSDLKNRLSEARENLKKEEKVVKNLTEGGISLTLETVEYKDYISPYISSGGFCKKYSIYVKSDDLSNGVREKLSTIVKRIIENRVSKEHELYDKLNDVFCHLKSTKYSFGLTKKKNLRKVSSALADVLTEYRAFLER